MNTYLIEQRLNAGESIFDLIYEDALAQNFVVLGMNDILRNEVVVAYKDLDGLFFTAWFDRKGFDAESIDYDIEANVLDAINPHL